MENEGVNSPPCTVTASYSINLRRPTPNDKILKITSEVIELISDRAKIRMSLICEEKICATGEGLFVAVSEGHPAYHRWN